MLLHRGYVRWLALALALSVALAASAQTIQYYRPNLPADRVVLCAADALSLTTSGTSEQAMASCQIPAGVLLSTYQGFHVEFSVLGAATPNTKTASVRVGGIAGAALIARVINVSGDTAFGSATCHLRDTTNLLICHGIQSVSGGTTSGNIYGSQITSGANFSSAIDIVFTLTTGTSAGDATLKSYRVELMKRPS